MTEFLLFVAVLVWFGRQFHGVRADRWRARGHALVPVFVMVGQDARAIWRMAAPAPRRLWQRSVPGGDDLDDELRDLLSGGD